MMCTFCLSPYVTSSSISRTLLRTSSCLCRSSKLEWTSSSMDALWLVSCCRSSLIRFRASEIWGSLGERATALSWQQQGSHAAWDHQQVQRCSRTSGR